jgi:hypothetical protein
MNLDQILNRRTEGLSSSTRSEILLSIGAALLFVAVTAWRLPPVHDLYLEVGLAAAILWAAISLYVFRHRIWRKDSTRTDSIAATGLEHYRRELERRRDHLKNEWLWHGPLVLASVILVSILAGRTFAGFQPFRNILPLLLVLAVWTGFGWRRRRLQVQELQRELDEIETLAH